MEKVTDFFPSNSLVVHNPSKQAYQRMNLNLKIRYYLQGYGILAVQAWSHQLRPIPCQDRAVAQISECKAATGGQAAMLYSGLYLVALGSGGIKAALPALGADQFDEKDPKEATQLSSFFNWFLFSLTIGSIIGVTFIVWIGANQGWDWSFVVCTIAILFAILFICMGNSLYRHNVPKGSPLLRIIQVLSIPFFYTPYNIENHQFRASSTTFSHNFS